MKHVIIGTAGHIDHGKTALIKALTGQDADRFPEEKKRGITIDLGYAWFDLGDIRAGFIDVPGHEKLISNMVSGVTGMDMVLFTVAADEGMMPQSFEHLDIMDILGVQRGIIVITKSDLADREQLQSVKEQISQEMKHTFLENAPVISTSIKTSEGINELLDVMKQMAQEIASERGDHVNTSDIPRLPVDRVFSLPGFGTIVTGTLLSGHIKKGDLLSVCPGETACRVRALQSYGQEVQEASAGQRCALNLPKLSVEKCARGSVIAPAGVIELSQFLNVRIRLSNHFTRQLESGMRAHLFVGTARVLCRIYLFRNDTSGYAQLRLEEPVCVLAGDHFILRFYSPLETIGGGVIIEANARRARMSDVRILDHIRHLEKVMNGLESKEDYPERRHDNQTIQIPEIPVQHRKAAAFLLKCFDQAGFQFVSVNALDLSAFSGVNVDQTLKLLERRGEIVRLDTYHYTTNANAEKAEKLVIRYCREHGELSTGLLRDLLGSNRTSARALLEYLDRKKITKPKGGAALHVLIQ